MPKVTQELVLSGGDKLAVKDSRIGDAPGEKVSDTDLFRKYMDMRARTFSMIGAAKYSTYRGLTDKYLGYINMDVAQGMRGPTLNEVRRFEHRDSEVVGEIHGQPRFRRELLLGAGRQSSVEALGSCGFDTSGPGGGAA